MYPCAQIRNNVSSLSIIHKDLWVWADAHEMIARWWVGDILDESCMRPDRLLVFIRRSCNYILELKRFLKQEGLNHDRKQVQNHLMHWQHGMVVDDELIRRWWPRKSVNVGWWKGWGEYLRVTTNLPRWGTSIDHEHASKSENRAVNQVAMNTLASSYFSRPSPTARIRLLSPSHATSLLAMISILSMRPVRWCAQRAGYGFLFNLENVLFPNNIPYSY